MFNRWLKKSDPRLDEAWPALPLQGFVVGRAATADDVRAGNAVFCQATDEGAMAEPSRVTIPQYALWISEDGSATKVVVVQGEKHVSDPDGEPVLGLRTFGGEEIVASGEEVRLLGVTRPAA